MSNDTHCGLYVHIPFCESKCGYCDFYSVARAGQDTASVIEAIGRELAHRATASPYPVRTVFFGGGTPTILPTEQLASLIESLSGALPVGRLAEFSVEANPATIDDDKVAMLVSSGVTRVSMGAQSFDAAELAVLERLHSPDDIQPSVETLRHHGIEHINLDLIFGIPGQTLDSWSQSLKRAIDLGVDHFACYGLTYEIGTRLTNQRDTGELIPCEENLEADMYLLAVDTLGAAGCRQYEISNFARPGGECLHNLIYWHNDPYIGVGPSAAGCVSGRRYKNVADIDEYVRMIDQHGHAEAESERVEGETLIHELIMMQLRLNEGLSIDSFRDRTGHDARQVFGNAVARLTDRDLLQVTDTHIALTGHGRLIADAVIADLAAALPGDTPTRLGH